MLLGFHGGFVTLPDPSSTPLSRPPLSGEVRGCEAENSKLLIFFGEQTPASNHPSHLVRTKDALVT